MRIPRPSLLLDVALALLAFGPASAGATVYGPSGLVHDVAGLCGLTVLGVPLGTAC